MGRGKTSKISTVQRAPRECLRILNLWINEVQTIHFVGDDADLVENAIREWIQSPYWSLGPGGEKWFKQRQIGEPLPENIRETAVERVVAIEENSLATHIREMCHQLRRAQQDFNPEMEPVALPLVDQYLSRPEGALSNAALVAIDEACMSVTSTEAVITLTDGRMARASLPTVLALVTTDALMSCVRFPVEHGIDRIIGIYRHRSFPRNAHRHGKVLLKSGAPLVDAALLLPTSAGRKARTQLAASPLFGVPVALYPLAATVLPEFSAHLVPIINIESIIGQTGLPRPVVKTSRSRALLWRLTHRNGGSGVLHHVLATVIARMRSSRTVLLVVRSLHRLGIDRSRVLSALARLLTRSSGNPWLDGRTLKSYEFTILEVEGSRIAL